MTDLTAHLQDYLRLRRSLGFKLEDPGRVLPQFVVFLEAHGAETITTELAITWAQLPQEVQPRRWAHRLGAVRGFARYLQTIDPSTEIPPDDVFGARQQRPAPYLWSDTDIRRLLEATHQLRPALWAATCETLFGLLAASGMRMGEALRLGRKDVDFASKVITIGEGKFGRSRLIPLHESTIAALKLYAARRDDQWPTSSTFFVSTGGAALPSSSVHEAFNQITTQIGLRRASVHPRLHDLRHTFAVRTLVGWLSDGMDVGVGMPRLSTYLGHVSPASTYWYLSASPELMELVAARLDGRFGGGR